MTTHAQHPGKVDANATSNYWPNLGSVHQVPIMAGWTTPAWNMKFAKYFYTWQALEILLIWSPMPYPLGHMSATYHCIINMIIHTESNLDTWKLIITMIQRLLLYPRQTWLRIPLGSYCVLGLKLFSPKRNKVSHNDVGTHWKLPRACRDLFGCHNLMAIWKRTKEACGVGALVWLFILT